MSSQEEQPPGRAALAAVGLVSRAREGTALESLPRRRGRPSTRTVLGELGSGLAAARLLGAVPRLATAPRGDGAAVVDIPGWRAPEVSGAPLRAYLRSLGHDARGWGFGTNAGDLRRDIGRTAEMVAALAEEKEGPVSLVGWSLGGVIAREVARRHPDAVRRVITYGTPLGRGAVAVRVPLTVLFTRRDGVVAWQSCLDRVSRDVEHVEVFSTHIGMGVDPDVWRVVADRLAGVVVSPARRPAR